MTKKITKMTEEQAAKMAGWVDKWVAHGLSTEPADFEKAEAAVRGLYKAIGKPQPKVILRLDSPYAACVGGVYAWLLLETLLEGQVWSQVAGQVRGQVRGQVDDQVLGQVWGQVDDQVRSQVRSQVMVQVRGQVDDQVLGQVRGQVDDQVWGQVRDQVDDQVRGQVRSQVMVQVRGQVDDQVLGQVRSQVMVQVAGQVRGQVRGQVAGQVRDQVRSQVAQGFYNLSQGAFWASWYAYISFMRDTLKWENKTLEFYKHGETLALNCGYVWWHEDVCVIVDRPKEIHLDGAGRLHSTTGPALSYRDGWSLYRVHGVEVPEEWITKPETLKPEMALTWENVEQRRALAELIGWSKILAQLPTTVIDADVDPEIGTLIEVDLPDSPKSRFLQVQCGTGRKFTLGVPSTMTTALEANAWTFSLDAKDLSMLEVRT